MPASKAGAESAKAYQFHGVLPPSCKQADVLRSCGITQLLDAALAGARAPACARCPAPQTAGLGFRVQGVGHIDPEACAKGTNGDVGTSQRPAQQRLLCEHALVLSSGRGTAGPVWQGRA